MEFCSVAPGCAEEMSATVLYCIVLYCVQEMSATGMNHTEGGWPREVRTDNAEHRIKYIRSACGYFLI